MTDDKPPLKLQWSSAEDHAAWTPVERPKAMGSWTKIVGPITSIKAIPWWQLAHAARLLLAGWQFYGPHKGSIVFVRVGEPMPIYGMPASTDDTHTGDDARPPYNAEAVRQALNPDEYP
jgi:hypothetical protein